MDIFSLGVLSRVVAELPQPDLFILNTFFRDIQTEQNDEIHFDVANGRRRLAPFVAPIVAGKLVESRGYKTGTFRPAYVKDKRIFDSTRPFKRRLGERIGGELDPIQRMQAILAEDLADQIDMLARRQEVMAIEALLTGGVTVKGEQYPETRVDFGRHADLIVELAGGERWGETGVDPFDDIETWSLNVAEQSGATANIVIMDLKAWKLFSASAKVQKLLDRFRGSDMLLPNVSGHGARYMGSTGSYDIWVYTGWYEHPDTGAMTPYLPDHTVVVTSQQLEGVRAYGAIKDEEAGFQAIPYFSKSWVDKDPAVRQLLLQSAPLPVPYRVNAAMSAKVR
jgi:hypothetical protein